jgi:hypothetical protein
MLPDYSSMYPELQGAAVCNRRLNQSAIENRRSLMSHDARSSAIYTPLEFSFLDIGICFELRRSDFGILSSRLISDALALPV